LFPFKFIYVTLLRDEQNLNTFTNKQEKFQHICGYRRQQKQESESYRQWQCGLHQAVLEWAAENDPGCDCQVLADHHTGRQGQLCDRFCKQYVTSSFHFYQFPPFYIV